MSTSQETILAQKRMLRMHTKLLSTILVLWITLMMNIEHIQSFINMCTDTFFLYGHNRTIEYFLQQNMQVFQYLLTYEGSYSLTSIYGFEPLGVSHADDLIYLFDPIFHGLLPELPDKGD